MKDYLYIILTTCIRFLLKIIPKGKINNKRIVFTSYLGKQYSCNPKYISQYIQAHSSDYEIVWAFNFPQNFNYLSYQGIKVVKYNSLHFIFLCMTSKYIVTNVRDLTHIPFSSKQLLINTWHGGGAYKAVGSATATQPPSEKYREKIAHKSPITFLSSSNTFTKLTIEKSFNHNGDILNCGMPRNDLLINRDRNDLISKVHNKLSVPEDCKILLYAPTYRESRVISDYQFDIEAVRAILKEKFGGNWVVLFRAHYYIAEKISSINSNYLNVSDYPDMQELLYVSDILITDYSSSIWDYSFTKRPCFLYATDLSDYDMKHGFYSDIRSWPFPLAQNNKELITNISNYDENTYIQKLIQHHTDLGSFETGHACDAVFHYLQSH